MTAAYDAFLEAQCAAQETQGRPLNLIALVKALREHSGLDLKAVRDIVEDFTTRRSASTPNATKPYIVGSLRVSS